MIQNPKYRSNLIDELTWYLGKQHESANSVGRLIYEQRLEEQNKKKKKEDKEKEGKTGVVIQVTEEDFQ